MNDEIQSKTIMKTPLNPPPALVVLVTLVLPLVTLHADESPPGPEGLRGFSGQVRGVVVRQREKHGVDFKVGRVLKTWKNNKATQPEKLKGRTVPVGPSWVRHDSGRWQPMETHLHFLKSLEPGEELTLELRHAEREHFAILELSGDQRKRAVGKEKDCHESEEEKKREAEIKELRRELKRLEAEVLELRKKREKR